MTNLDSAMNTPEARQIKFRQRFMDYLSLLAKATQNAQEIRLNVKQLFSSEHILTYSDLVQLPFLVDADIADGISMHRIPTKSTDEMIFRVTFMSNKPLKLLTESDSVDIHVYRGFVSNILSKDMTDKYLTIKSGILHEIVAPTGTVVYLSYRRA